MADPYRFRQLKERAAKIQKAQIDKVESRLKQEKDLAKKEVITGQDVVNYLLYVGLDFKGQMQMAYEARGYGGTAEVSVNPLGLVGLNAEARAAGSIKAAKQRTIIVSRGPTKVQAARIPQPILVNSLIGKYWEANAQLSLDVGVGYDFSAEGGPGKVRVQAKVGARAAGGYTYDHFYGEDLYPLSYAKIQSAREKLDVILQEGSTKTMLKREACEFINKKGVPFGVKPIDLHGKVLWHTTTKGHKEVINRLEQLAEKAPESVKKEAEHHIAKLSHFTEKGDGTVFLRISSHKPEGKAEVYGRTEAQVGAGELLAFGAGDELSAGVSGSYKRSHARFQSRVLAVPSYKGLFRHHKPETILTTYDSVITYSTFHLGRRIKLDATSFGFESIGVKKVITADKKFYEPDSLNKISYRTAIATWRKPVGHREKFIKKEGLWKKPKNSRDMFLNVHASKVNSLGGTGVAFGRSCVVGTLNIFINNHYNFQEGKWKNGAKEDGYVKKIAKELQVTEDQVLQFLMHPEVLPNIAYYLPLNAGVLLEATHRIVPLPKLVIKRGTDPDTRKELIQLSPDFGKNLFNEKRELESIRLRYRRRDVYNRDSKLFTVGFKVQGTGAKISLERVERAGTDGIFDVATVFLHPSLVKLAKGESQVPAYEQAVPPAALFFQ